MNKKSILKISLSVASVVLAALPAVAAQPESDATSGTVNLTGRVSCSRMGASVPYQKGYTQSMAIQQCISQGYTYVLVVGKQVYPLSGDSKQLAKLAGETVTVAGHLTAAKPAGTESAFNGTLEATTIKPTSN